MSPEETACMSEVYPQLVAYTLALEAYCSSAVLRESAILNSAMWWLVKVQHKETQLRIAVDRLLGFYQRKEN
jgi:hypothetical protein